MNEDEIEPEVSVEEVDDEHVQYKGIKDVLEHISGVDEREAEILHDHGYHSEEEIRNAEQMELAGIEGIGNALAARMKADVGGLGVDDSEQNEDDECNSPKLGMLNIGSVDSNELTIDNVHRVYRYNDEDTEIEVGDDVDEITLKKDGEERTVDVDYLFEECGVVKEEEMDCTCGPNEACSECPDGKFGSTGEEMRNVETDFDTETSDVELEQESNEDREVCSAQYCENWQSECEKH